MSTPKSIIGKGERRVDALGKVTGRAKFAADYNAGHQLYGKVLRSEHPHARIVRIDTAAAKRLPGVEAVLTILRREFEVAMRQAGATSVGGITRSFVAKNA